VSFTVTVKVHEATVSVHVTVVVPTGKKDPDGGVHVIVPQSPVDVGAGKVTTAPHWFGSLLCVTLAAHVMTHGSTPGAAGGVVEAEYVPHPTAAIAAQKSKKPIRDSMVDPSAVVTRTKRGPFLPRTRRRTSRRE
jgi:hypothetical protein